MFWVTFEHNMMGNVSSFFTACSIVSQAAHRMVTINNLNIIVFEQHHKNSITHFVILYSNFPILFANRSSTSEREAASELEAQRIAGLSQSSLMVRLNSLAYMLDALAGHEASVQEWWQRVNVPPTSSHAYIPGSTSSLLLECMISLMQLKNAWI